MISQKRQQGTILVAGAVEKTLKSLVFVFYRFYRRAAGNIIIMYVEIAYISVLREPFNQGGAERDEYQDRHQPIGGSGRREIETQEEKCNRYEDVADNFGVEFRPKDHYGVEICRQQQEYRIRCEGAIPD